MSSDQAAMKPGYNYVQSLARGLKVIRSFGAYRRAQTLSELAKSTQLDKSVARRISLTLVNLGYMNFEGGKYSLTPRVLDLGFAYMNSTPILAISHSIVETLANETREPCAVGILDGCDVLHVKNSSAGTMFTMNMQAGMRVPAYCTSMGRVLMSGLSRERVDDILDKSNLIKRTENTVTDRSKILAIIEETRQRGWCMVTEELERGLISLSVPIYGHDREMIACLNISSHTQHKHADVFLENVLGRVRSAAGEITFLITGDR